MIFFKKKEKTHFKYRSLKYCFMFYLDCLRDDEYESVKIKKIVNDTYEVKCILKKKRGKK